ncbi:hypothetical protein PF005_g21438 [Phytophthora fragariae]|uniref:CCHC-type domain-containing protein n=1 Tax=Phytophthora fragariae TaxID=53985 RepID=A0A6A3WH15_9STRA|nr:hypothetical protein PF003_g5753 [Phytophthora fragariae]KAE8929894.1 hypothetical protein PF009_g20002 [Phytophthora fragariae]KAE9081997.1 hypothetical protein PF010_g21768 [Phytophthora fragariae]KAE9084483.1 hypothetical protein PF007_g21503 [Phytophthora fragariae]KAE9107066.1 hypothetical protein PF006_g21205 [Phytophthora fragariae]
MQVERKRAAVSREAAEPRGASSKPPVKREKREAREISDSEYESKPQKKKFKVAVKQLTTQEKTNSGPHGTANGPPVAGAQRCFKCGHFSHWATECPNDVRCYACRQYGHLAKECPDAEAKARNDEYLKTREPKSKSSENERRA